MKKLLLSLSITGALLLTACSNEEEKPKESTKDKTEQADKKKDTEKEAKKDDKQEAKASDKESTEEPSTQEPQPSVEEQPVQQEQSTQSTQEPSQQAPVEPTEEKQAPTEQERKAEYDRAMKEQMEAGVVPGEGYMDTSDYESDVPEYGEELPPSSSGKHYGVTPNTKYSYSNDQLGPDGLPREDAVATDENGNPEPE